MVKRQRVGEVSDEQCAFVTLAHAGLPRLSSPGFWSWSVSWHCLARPEALSDKLQRQLEIRHTGSTRVLCLCWDGTISQAVLPLWPDLVKSRGWDKRRKWFGVVFYGNQKCCPSDRYLYVIHLGNCSLAPLSGSC